MEISIDNQYVTKSLQRYRFLPKQPNTEKITNLMIFLNLGWVQNAEMINIVITKICQYWQLFVMNIYHSTLNFCQWWHFLWSSTLKNGIFEE